MENKHINDLIKRIAHKKNEIKPYFKLKDIKDLAIAIRKDGYLISNKTNKNQIDDPFLNSPYFDLVAEVWDSQLTAKDDQEVARKFANELIEAGYDVKKKNRG